MINADSDIPFHYPPELFNLLVDVIPLLNRTKKDVILFFKGAGVPEKITSDIASQLKASPDNVNKFDIVRKVLERLNVRGEPALRERREILRRVVDFSSFDSCWPDDQLRAKGLVTSIREVVNQKDAFTRMNNAREEERRARLEESRRNVEANRERCAQIDTAKKNLFALFNETVSAQERGKRLESVLNEVFKAYGILIKESFHLVGGSKEGIVEQIDGVIELDSRPYLVEMKWYHEPVGVPEISQQLVRLMSRNGVRGIFISASDYTKPAILLARQLLQQKVLILVTLQEIVFLLERGDSLTEFFSSKVRAAQIDKNPFLKPYDT